MKKEVSIIFIIICFVFISCVGGGSIYLNDNTISIFENRTLATYPQYNQERLLSGDFFNDYEEYSLDQMVGRDNFIDLLNTVKVFSGKKEINKIIIGNDNELLAKYKYEEIANNDYKKRNSLVADEIKNIKNATDTYGGKTIYMHVMYQNEFYKDSLPSQYKYLSKNYDDYNQDLLDKVSLSGAEIVDCNQTIRKHQDEYLYYKTDHHWTPKGALYAYNTLIKKLNINKSQSNWDDMNCIKSNKVFMGSMTSQIGSSYFEKQDSFEYYKGDMPDYSRKTSLSSITPQRNTEKLFQDNKTKYSKYSDIEQSNYAIDNFYTNQNDKKNILIIGCSYKQALIEYALNDFNRVMLLDPRTYNGNINDYIKSVQADYVIVLRDDLYEGNIGNVAILK